MAELSTGDCRPQRRDSWTGAWENFLNEAVPAIQIKV